MTGPFLLHQSPLMRQTHPPFSFAFRSIPCLTIFSAPPFGFLRCETTAQNAPGAVWGTGGLLQARAPRHSRTVKEGGEGGVWEPWKKSQRKGAYVGVNHTSSHAGARACTPSWAVIVSLSAHTEPFFCFAADCFCRLPPCRPAASIAVVTFIHA